jgi:hypothetical protein
MFDDDQLTQSPELGELRDSLNCLALPARPPLAAIAARGRAHRRHRLCGVAGLFVAGAAAGAAVTVALAGGGSTNQGALPALSPGRSHPPREIMTSSYTLISDTSGKVKLTIKPGKLFDAAELQSDLARYGIPAKVTKGRLCTSDPQPDGLPKAVSISTTHETITFDPSGIPAGEELSIGHFWIRDHVQLVDVVLIRTGSFSCTSHVPTDRPFGKPGQGFGFIAIPAGRATSHG